MYRNMVNKEAKKAKDIGFYLTIGLKDPLFPDTIPKKNDKAYEKIRQ